MSKRYWALSLLLMLLLPVGVVIGVNYEVENTTRNQLYTDVNRIPKNKVGLLLGTAKYADKVRKIINMYYQNRIDAAVALYMAGKIDFIIASGEASTNYDEPRMMKADLIAKGVPASAIYIDNSGFRTLDSILRCHYIFGQDHITIISQEFHNQRALYIANHKNITAVAFNAADGDAFIFVAIRERLARVRMGLDLLLNRQALHYGEKVDMP